MDEAVVKQAIGLKPRDAIAFMRGKGATVTGSWAEWLDGQHARAFTVANVAKLDVVSDIQDSLVKALQEGTTFEAWKRDLIPTLQRKGWWRREGTAEQLQAAGRVDPATGELAKGLTPHRLATIYKTNMQTAYMAGRHDQMVAQARLRPYWQYVAVLDGKTRPTHRAMNGRIFRFDDPGWRSFYPPCGFNCRCRVSNLSQREVDRDGLVVESTAGRLSNVQVPLRNGSTATVTRYTGPGMGPKGFQPDPGFSNNPGASVWMPRLGDRPTAVSDAFVRQAVQGPAFSRFVQARGALEGSFPVGVRVADEAAGAAAQTRRVDPGVYLDSSDLAAGVVQDVPRPRLQLLPDLVAYGRQADGGLELTEADGVLRAVLAERDGITRIVSLSWMPSVAQ